MLAARYMCRCRKAAYQYLDPYVSRSFCCCKCRKAGSQYLDPYLRQSLILLQVQEAEQRLEYGLHYGIPYPRLHHASQFPRRYTLTAPQVEPSAPPQSKRVPCPPLC